MPVPPPPPKPPASPRLSGLRPATVTVDDLAADAHLDAVALEAPQLSEVRSEFADLLGVRIVGGVLADGAWYRASWADVSLDGTDVANTRWDESGWRRVNAQRCRMTGVVLSGCTVEDVAVTGGVLDLSSWRFAKLTRVRFEGCALNHADFMAAQLTDVSFVDCSLRQAQFSQSRHTRVRFERCALDGLHGVASLRGATITPVDLLALTDQLAEALGITVESG